MIGRIRNGWKALLALNQFGRCFIAIGIGAFFFAISDWIDPPSILSSQESYMGAAYRLFGRSGPVIVWMCFGSAFIWIGLLVGKRKEK